MSAGCHPKGEVRQELLAHDVRAVVVLIVHYRRSHCSVDIKGEIRAGIFEVGTDRGRGICLVGPIGYKPSMLDEEGRVCRECFSLAKTKDVKGSQFCPSLRRGGIGNWSLGYDESGQEKKGNDGNYFFCCQVFAHSLFHYSSEN